MRDSTQQVLQSVQLGDAMDAQCLEVLEDAWDQHYHGYPKDVEAELERVLGIRRLAL